MYNPKLQYNIIYLNEMKNDNIKKCIIMIDVESNNDESI